MQKHFFIISVALLLFACDPSDTAVIDSNSTSIEVAFSPEMGGTELIVKAISEAHSSIRLAAYSFTSKPIAEALVKACQRGVDVKIVVDKSQARIAYTAAKTTKDAGIPTRVDYRYSIMHNKFIVIDGRNVETGSFNFTSAAEHHNAENVLLLHDNAKLAASYLKEWNLLWGESEEY